MDQPLLTLLVTCVKYLITINEYSFISVKRQRRRKCFHFCWLLGCLFVCEQNYLFIILTPSLLTWMTTNITNEFCLSITTPAVSKHESNTKSWRHVTWWRHDVRQWSRVDAASCRRQDQWHGQGRSRSSQGRRCDHASPEIYDEHCF